MFGEKHEYIINDFRLDIYHRTIEEEGHWSENRNCYSCNYSSILTDLIQNTGRFCEKYASDLFISWKAVEHYLSEKHNAGDSKTFLFGVRELGVDSADFVLCRYNNQACYGTPDSIYRKLFILKITIEEDESVKMEYGKCNVKYYM